MKKRVKILAALVLIMMMTISGTAFAEGGSGAKSQRLAVVKIKELEKDYHYETGAYDEESELMPVASDSNGFMKFGGGFGSSEEGYGYADKNGKIKIPIHKNWSNVWKFNNGLAVIQAGDYQNAKVSAIDTTGKVLFDFEKGLSISGGYIVGWQSSYLQRLEKDPYGMCYAHVEGNGDIYLAADNLTLTIYGRQGKYLKTALPYDRIGDFNNGVATLYNIKDTKMVSTGFGIKPDTLQYIYIPVAAINTKGEIVNIPVTGDVKPKVDEDYGFQTDSQIVPGTHLKILSTIKNREGKEIYRYTYDYYNDKPGGYQIINENALLVPQEKEDGTTAYTLMDSNGTLYPEYQFSSFEVSYGGDRFIARPYKTEAEKLAYVKKAGLPAEEKDSYLVFDATQPLTIYGIEKAPDPINVNGSGRLAGATRYETAVAISQKGWPQSDNVILANGANFPDALVGSSFAYSIDAPILLTPSAALNSSTKAEIERLGAKNIYILGNNESVSQFVESSLSDYNVTRIGGAGIFDTAVAIGEKLRETVQFDTVAIATQANFPDSLAIAPFSAKYTLPILFTEKDKLRGDTKKALQDWGIKKVIITGGTGVVSGAVEAELSAMGISVTRLAGDDRYDTCLDIVKHFEAQSGGYSRISIATGNNYPDSLSGAVLAAKNNAPVILVNKDKVKPNVADYLNAKSIENAFIFGGSGVVSDSVLSTDR